MTVHRWLFLTISLTFVSEIHSKPLDLFPKFHLDSKTETSWLWNWAWGAENTVAIVDRSPALSFPSRPAAFGPELTSPLLGYVIPLSSFTVPCQDLPSNVSHNNNKLSSNQGCPTLCKSGPHEPERTDTWIALVQRGKCEFVSKVREAQRLGAKAVVVGGDDPEMSGNPDILVNMYSPSDSSDIHISSTFIRYSNYMELSALIATSETSHSGLRTLSLLITAEYSAWDWYSPIITFILLLLLPSSLTFITLLIHRVRAARAAQRDRAPEDIVNSLPWRVYTGTGWEKHGQPKAAMAPLQGGDAEQGTVEPSEPSDDNDPSTSHGGDTWPDPPWFDTQVECPICLSEFVKGDRVRELPCQHIFHLDEVDEWLIQRKKTCPVCKADVTRPPHSEVTDQLPVAEEPESGPDPTERSPLLSSSETHAYDL